MSLERSSELFSAVDTYNEAHDSWASDDNSGKYPTLAYWDAFDRMLTTFEGGDLPSNCRELAIAVYELAREKAAFDLRDDPDPGQKFWHLRERLSQTSAKLRSPMEKHHVEPIAELYKQGVNLEQIGRMWGLVRADGTGLVHLVQQELNKPGSVIGPDYVHPKDKEREREANAARQRYLELSAQVNQQEEAKAEEVSKPCPESSHQLWLEKVNLPQAARMLKRDQSDVSAEWSRFERESKGSPPVDSPLPTEAQKVVDLGEPVISGQADIPLEEAVEEVNPYAEFDEWEVKHVRARLKELGLKAKKGATREDMLDQILEAESQGVPISETGEPIAQN